MTKGTFGETLRRERELRGVTLDEISSATRISKRFLEALENEQWDHLPGGVFNRGFVKAVAHYLGLDEDDTVEEYVLAVDDYRSVPVWTGTPPAVTPGKPWLAWIAGGVAVILLVTGGWFGVGRLVAQHEIRQAANGDPIHAPHPPLATRTAGPSVAAVAPAAGIDPGANTSAVLAAAPDSPSANAPVQPALNSFELTVEAVKAAKINVVADSDVVFDGAMKAGEKRSFSAKDHFQVSADDAGAVQLQIGGKVLAPMGPPGQPSKVTLAQDALKRAAGGGD